MKLLLTGDYFYDYQNNQNDFELIKERLSAFDYTILNYEGSFESKNRKNKAVNLSMSQNSLNFKNKNILFCLANNHIFDYGLEGYKKTISLMNDNSLGYFGLELKRNFFDNFKILEKDSLRVCIASFGWANEECVLSESNNPGNVNLTKKNIDNFFKKINGINFDKLIIYVHYGYEYEYYPLPLHVDLLRYFIDKGADLVYGSHSHIIQPYEIYKNKYIFYGLGNFYFGSRRKVYPEISDKGLFLELDICKTYINIVPKYIIYNRKLNKSDLNVNCDFYQKYLLKILSFAIYSKKYKKIRLRKKNPRPILYKNSVFINNLKYKSWKLIVDITGFLKVRKIIKVLLRWE